MASLVEQGLRNRRSRAISDSTMRNTAVWRNTNSTGRDDQEWYHAPKNRQSG